MPTITLAIVAVFVVGYSLIALESFTRVNKAAIALLMFVVCWTIFAIDPSLYISGLSGNALYSEVNTHIVHHLGDTATTLFFLIGAMTIVEVVDQHGGFNFVRDTLSTASKRSLLVRISCMTFVLSAILDNLTTSIVMVMLLRKLIDSQTDRMIFASMIIIAANSGGAFSPIGDVTTIMLWNEGVVTASGVIEEITIPSIVSMVVPLLILLPSLKGDVVAPETPVGNTENELNRSERRTVFALGVGGLIFVPIFHSLTGLPPFMGIMLALGLLWLMTELFYGRKKKQEGMKKRVVKVIKRIDMGTIFFFLGILMAVNCLQEVGVLTALGGWLDGVSGGNHYLVTGTIGILSSIVDNVPLVAGCLGMYPVAPTGDMAVDGIFWQLLAYCAGVGGSMLIIGSAAGVVVMGLEKISFGWYLKRISWLALVGYLAGMLTYWIIRTFILPVP